MKYKIKQFKNIKYTIKDNKSDTTLLMVHGYKSSSDTFLPLYEEENNYNILSINYLGNKYYEGNNNHSIKEISDSISELISSMETDVILVGHSLGGAVISEVKDQKEIKGYVFISSFTKSFLDSKLHDTILKIVNKNLPEEMLDTMIKISSKRFGFDPEYIKGFLNPGKGFERLFKENILNRKYIEGELDDNIRKISKPIIAMIGDGDFIVPVKSYKKYFNELEVEVNEINDSEHNPMSLNPKAVNEILNNSFSFEERTEKNIIKQQD